MQTGKGDRREISRYVCFLVLAGIAWAITIFLGFSSASAAADAPAEVLRLANGEWPPYTGQDLPAHGCDSQVVVEAFALEGIQVHFDFLPWARGLLLSQNGMVDGAVEWAGTPEQRQTHFVSSDFLSQQQWVFFHRKNDDVTWERLDDLTQKNIGLTIGYAYSDVFADLKRQHPAMFHEAANDVLNFRKLVGGRIDLFPLERSVGYFLLKRELSEEDRARLTANLKPLAEFTPYLLLSRAIPENEWRMQLFDRGLQQLKASKRYEEIMARCTSEPRVTNASD
jgi:polar amino acid transport system substrate-binding protein